MAMEFHLQGLLGERGFVIRMENPSSRRQHCFMRRLPFDNAKHYLPSVGSQSYLDETLKKESSALGIANKVLLMEVNKEDAQTNKEHAQVGTNLDLLPGDNRVT